MRIPIKYTLRNFSTRRLTTGLTVAGVAMVTFVFAAVLMMANGLQRTLISTGSDDNVIVLRKSATSEITSIIDREQADIVSTLPGVAKDAAGMPLMSREAVVIINLPYADAEGFGNLTVRGVTKAAMEIRPQVRLTSGQLFRWGSREIIVGEAAQKRFSGASTGDEVTFGGDRWRIVGTFSGNGSGFDSEIWGDADQLGQAFERPVYSTLTFRLTGYDALKEFREGFDKDNRLLVLDAKREKQFYAEQSEMMSAFISVLGIGITIIFSFGATIGAMITMYAAVANRTVEIGTLRALGFRRRSILSAFLVEAVILALGGGLIGLLLASSLQFFTVSMINFSSFAELAFSFSLSPGIVVGSLLFALAMGLLGGFLPAARAARLNILTALRSA